MNDLALKKLLRSKGEKPILTGKISEIEDKNENIACATVWYENIKILIPRTHLRRSKVNKPIIRGMIGAEIEFFVMEIDTISNIAIASKIDAIELRKQLEIPNLRVNDIVRIRIFQKIHIKIFVNI